MLGIDRQEVSRARDYTIQGPSLRMEAICNGGLFPVARRGQSAIYSLGKRARSKAVAGSAERRACEEDEERKMEGIRTSAREGARQRAMMADPLSRRSSGSLWQAASSGERNIVIAYKRSTAMESIGGG